MRERIIHAAGVALALAALAAILGGALDGAAGSASKVLERRLGLRADGRFPAGPSRHRDRGGEGGHQPQHRHADRDGVQSGDEA